MKLVDADRAAEPFFMKEARVWSTRYQSRSYKQRREVVLAIVKKEVGNMPHKPRTIELLDFGCGSGVLLRDMLDLGLSVTGVDNSPAMIDAARDYLGMDESLRLELLPGDSEEGDYEDQNYNIVLCISVLEFIRDVEGLVARLCSCVAPGGMFVVSVPNSHSWMRSMERLIHRHPAIFGHFAQFNHLTHRDSYLIYQKHQFGLDQLARMVKDHGLQLEQHRFHVTPSWLARLERSERVGMMLMAAFRRPNSAA